MTASIRRRTPSDQHLDAVAQGLEALRGDLGLLEHWATDLAARLVAGGRLLAAGNGGSAAHAQHLTAELVGRFRTERQPLSAIALHAETSTLTALVNDYGIDAMFERQVVAHGRPGDVLLLLSTSGNSTNLVTAAHAARRGGLTVRALTGAGPNRLAAAADEVVTVASSDAAVVQDVHQVAVHLLCAQIDVSLAPGNVA
jgi:D-sedoheptulose 7-phosphate isomerase